MFMQPRRVLALSNPLIRTMTTSARDAQIFKLPDGRTLGFAEYGAPDGYPLFYFHGYPSSRLEAGPLESIARRYGFRVLALDRPGFGLSSPQPRHQFRDWPEDVRAFARGMDIHRFAVLGLSGGGPFALACARFLPPEMLTGVGLFASGPHWAAGRHHMTWIRRVLSQWSVYAPSSLVVAMDMLVGFWKWIISTNFVTKRLDRWLESAKEKKKKGENLIEDEHVAGWLEDRPVAEKREALTQILLQEPFRQGSRATVHEAVLLSAQDWGFKLEDVDFNEVKIWHGAKDVNAPIAAIRYIAERLPHCTLHEFPDDTHYTMWKYLEGVLKELVPKEKEV
ncbi:Alpha/Beta hydrolase protein [Mariannaea sp. PMI_226]|nr:Alpha/Beta hydrolase protein [Mariannaea sp. PMI_226]